MVKVKKKRKVQKNRSGNPNPYQAQKAASRVLKGNKFWQIRSKHGRDKLFANPQLLLEAAAEYFEWCDKNPFKAYENKVVSVGDGGGSVVQEVSVRKKRPYTMEGLCNYLDCALSYFREFRRTSTDKGFLTVIEKIQQVVYDQQFGGASSGFFNANIISRALGLVDKQDVTSGGERIEAPKFNVYNNAPPLSSDEKEVDKK
jgi:hypothetical protein